MTNDFGYSEWCPHCKKPLKSMGVVDKEVTIEQTIDKKLFRLILIAIVVRDIGNIIVSAYTGSNKDIGRSFGGLFWDSIFLSFLSNGKNWASILLKIKYIIAFFTAFGIYYSENNYLFGSLDLILIICIILLLFSKTYSKFPKYTFAVYCVGLLTLIFFQFQGVIESHKEKNIISKIVSPLEYTSKFHYVIKLPSKDWKIIAKDEAIKLMGFTPKNFDVAVSNKSASVFGTFLPEEITKKNIKMTEFIKKLSEYMKTNALSGVA